MGAGLSWRPISAVFTLLWLLFDAEKFCCDICFSVRLSFKRPGLGLASVLENLGINQ